MFIFMLLEFKRQNMPDRTVAGSYKNAEYERH